MNKSGVKRPVIVITESESKQYKSVAEASRNCEIPVQKIYNILYLKCTQIECVKFFFL